MITTRRVFVYDSSSGETYQVGGGIVRPRLVGVSVGAYRGGRPEGFDGRRCMESASSDAMPSNVRSATEYGTRDPDGAAGPIDSVRGRNDCPSQYDEYFEKSFLAASTSVICGASCIFQIPAPLAQGNAEVFANSHNSHGVGPEGSTLVLAGNAASAL